MIKARFKKHLLGSKGAFDLNIDLEIKEAEVVALLGESGAGKSTILRILAGLEAVSSGYIEVNHSVWLDTQKKIFLKPQQRKIGFVFQDYALFPHLNVYQNIAFAHPKDKDKIHEVLRLNAFRKSKPAKNSSTLWRASPTSRFSKSFNRSQESIAFR